MFIFNDIDIIIVYFWYLSDFTCFISSWDVSEPTELRKEVCDFVLESTE